MEATVPDLAEPFETWLLRRVADAVEAGEVSAELLAELHAEIAEARERPPEARHALALMELADRVNLPVDRLTELLATLEAQPTATRELGLLGFRSLLVQPAGWWRRAGPALSVVTGQSVEMSVTLPAQDLARFRRLRHRDRQRGPLVGLPGSALKLLPATLPEELASAAVLMVMASTPALAPGTRPQPRIFHRFVDVRHA